MKISAFLAGLLACALPAFAQEMAVPTGEAAGLWRLGNTGGPEPVITRGEVYRSPITDHQSPPPAYVVDTIKLPDPNPWGAPVVTSGFDFFEGGSASAERGTEAAASAFPPPTSDFRPDAAVCTFHGDVFLVSGLDEKLERVTWRRFASGLYHPLGLKIVKGEIFVTCRDGLWRLNDLNKDGECDFYELFNGDLKVTKNFHEFVFDLQTDAAGHFHFAKAGPVRRGGFNVVADLARDFRGINPSTIFYGHPLFLPPDRVDSSGGSQVWVPAGDRWGPWSGRMLHLSYGQSSLYGVLMEEVKGRVPGAPPPPAATDKSDFAQAVREGFINYDQRMMQGGVTRFPLQFQGGIMRARFNPRDGQLYVMGLRGWQTNGLKNGCFQRVRFTGAVPRMPIEMHAKKGGIELRFACSLDTQAAADPENWRITQRRYLWSDVYDAAEYPAEGAIATARKRHDPVPVKSVRIGTDDRTVFLEISDLRPVMQMAIRYDLKTADGDALRGEVVNTIRALGAE